MIFTVILILNVFASTSVFAESETEFQPKVLALGDSIPYGTSLPDRSYAFPNLILEGNAVVKNVSVPGLTSDGLLTQITSDSTTMEAIEVADVITINIGNNDLLQAVDIKAIQEALLKGNPVDFEKIKAKVGVASKLAGENLQQILASISTQNEDAVILLYNMYNPFPNLESEPFKTLHALGEEILKPVNTSLGGIPLLYPNTIVLDAYHAFNGKQLEYVYPNDVHPTEKGHVVLASLATEELLAFIPQPEPPPIYELELSYSTDETEGPLTIHVDTKGEVPLKLLWMPGERKAEDFMNASGVHTITKSTFEVSENGVYTVLGIFSEDFSAYALSSIEVTSIVPKKEPPVKEEPPVEEEPPVQDKDEVKEGRPPSGSNQDKERILSIVN